MMNDNLKMLIRSIVMNNDMRTARIYCKMILNGEKAERNQSFVRAMLGELSKPQPFELPPNLEGLLFKEDVAASYRPARYFISQREEELAGKIMLMNRASEKMRDAGINYLNSTLLTGKPGTGKTSFARFLAYKMNLPLVYVNISSVVDSLMGGTSKNLQRIFDYVGKVPCVFLLDELDSICGNRDGGGDSAAGKETFRTTLALMQNLDQLSSETILLAATNKTKLLDDAVFRRFHFVHEVKMLDAAEMEQLLICYLRDIEECVGEPIPFDEQDICQFCAPVSLFQESKQSPSTFDAIHTLEEQVARYFINGSPVRFCGGVA